jgi:SAM-dependent methyltransferase
VKRHAPATGRNREPLAQILRTVLPPAGMVLEIAAGTGEHAAYFARLFPQLRWQPTDADPQALLSIEAWAADSGAPNLLAPLVLDAAGTWPIDAADAILAVNMVHISPWSATQGLLRGAARILPPGAPLILYGPYIRAGHATAPSNQDFDASLKSRNPESGLRSVEEVTAEAEPHGLRLEALHEMPANNLTLILRRD